MWIVRLCFGTQVTKTNCHCNRHINRCTSNHTLSCVKWFRKDFSVFQHQYSSKIITKRHNTHWLYSAFQIYWAINEMSITIKLYWDKNRHKRLILLIPIMSVICFFPHETLTEAEVCCFQLLRTLSSKFVENLEHQTASGSMRAFKERELCAFMHKETAMTSLLIYNYRLSLMWKKGVTP